MSDQQKEYNFEKYSLDEILETELALAIQEELNKELVNFVVHNEPITSTPVIFETEEHKAAFNKKWDEVISRDIFKNTKAE